MKKEIISGVYKIENKVNGKFYIGSSKNIYSRWKQHISYLNNQKHNNPKLQRAWNKYGQDNFKFSIIEKCDEDLIKFREQRYIDLTNCCKVGYNIASNAFGFTECCNENYPQIDKDYKNKYGIGLYINKDFIKEIDDDAMLFRVIYLACFIDKDNKIIIKISKNKKSSLKKDIIRNLDLGKTSSYSVFKYLINKKLININDKNEVFINKNFAKKTRNKIDNSILINIEYIKKLYKKYTGHGHKHIGKLFKISNILNYNLLCDENFKKDNFLNIKHLNLSNVSNILNLSLKTICVGIEKVEINDNKLFRKVKIGNKCIYGIHPMLYCDSNNLDDEDWNFIKYIYGLENNYEEIQEYKEYEDYIL